MKQILMERLQCSEKIATILEGDLKKMDASLMPLLNTWLETGSWEDATLYQGYSIASLMKKYKMTFPAALLTVDWILKDPATACKALSEPIR